VQRGDVLFQSEFADFLFRAGCQPRDEARFVAVFLAVDGELGKRFRQYRARLLRSGGVRETGNDRIALAGDTQ